MEFYATNDGEASASLLGFQLEESSASVSTAGITGASAQLVSLNESSLALLGTLLTITLETTDTEGAVEGVAAASGPGGAGQSLYGRTDSSDEIEELGDSIAVKGANSPSQSTWARYVTGVDQAIEKLRSEADARLLQEQQAAEGPRPWHILPRRE